MAIRVLFFDADGCLHPDPPRAGLHRLCWLPTLAELSKPHADLRLVLHSSWRLAMPADFLAHLFSPLGHRFLGATSGPLRYPSITAWIAASDEPVVSYRIVDDMPSEFPTPAPTELIVCPGRQGITNHAVRSQISDWLG